MTDMTTAAAWDVFVDELDAFMTWREMTAPELAQLVLPDDDGTRIRQWRAGNGRPAFSTFPRIVRALRMNAESRRDYDEWTATKEPDRRAALEAHRTDGAPDWTYLIARMGLAEPADTQDAAELAVNVAKLQSHRQSLDEGFDAYAQAGLSRLVRDVVATEEWAIAIWPAIEGPVLKLPNGERLDLRLHVADRIDFRRVDGSRVTKDMVWDTFEDAIKASRAVAATPDGERWVDATALAHSPEIRERVSPWSIRRLAAPHPSSIEQPYPRLPAVAVTSLTVASWANDVADHLSRLIGYGFTSTRDAATDLHGKRNDVRFGESRARIHGQMLRGSMAKRVWGHFSADATGLPDLLGDPAIPSTFTVYLHQPIGDLESEAGRIWNRQVERSHADNPREPGLGNQDEIFRHLRDVRRRLVAMLPDQPANNLHIVHLSGKVSSREGKYQRCLDIAVDVLELWFERKLLSRNDIEGFWNSIERKKPHLRSDGDRHTLMLASYYRHRMQMRDRP